LKETDLKNQKHVFKRRIETCTDSKIRNEYNIKNEIVEAVENFIYYEVIILFMSVEFTFTEHYKY